MISVTRWRSVGVIVVPDGKQRPLAKSSSATEPPTVSQPLKTGWRCMGFHSGRDSMFSASRARRTSSLVACRAEFIRIDGDHRQPAIVKPPRGLGHEIDAGQIAQRLAVGLEDLPLASHTILQHPQLPPANSRQDVAHAIVVADLSVLVVGRGIPCLGG